MLVSLRFLACMNIQDVCRRLRWATWPPRRNFYARQGDPSKYTEIPKKLAEVESKVPDLQVQNDLDATATWAAANGGNPDKLPSRLSGLVFSHGPQPQAEGRRAFYTTAGEPSDLNPLRP